MRKSRATGASAELILMAVLLVLGGMGTAHATNFLDQVQSSYQQASSSWMNGAINIARDIFAGAVGAEFVWWGIQRLLRGGEVNEMLTGVMLKVVTLGFFFTFMTYAPQWIPDIVHSFSDIGQQLGGSSVSTPSGVFDLGIQVANQLVQSLVTPGLSLSAIGKFVLSAIIVGLSALVVVLAYGIIALQLLITNIESYIVLGVGVVFSGFFGSRWTLPFAEKYIGYAVHVGIKLMVLYLIVGLAPTIANDATSFINTFHATAGNSYPPLADYMNVGVGSLIFGVVGYMIPSLAGSLMSGTPAMSMGNAMPTAAAIGGATAAAPAAAAGIAALAGGGLAGAIANRTISAATGTGNSISGGGGLGGAMGGLMGGSFGKSASSAAGGGIKAGGLGTQTAGQAGGGSLKQKGQGAAGNMGPSGISGGVRPGDVTQPANSSKGTSGAVPGKGGTDSLGGGQAQGTAGGSGSGGGAGETKKPTISQRFQNAGKDMLKQAGKMSPDPRRTPHDGNTGGGIGIRFKHHDE